MSRHVLILDTSVLCCLLQVPGKDEAGPLADRWTYDRIKAVVDEGTAAGSTFVLPTATLIETGNHIAQAAGDRYAVAMRMSAVIRASAKARTPWAAFKDQAALWSEERLEALAVGWPELAAGGLTIGDATIKDVAELYAEAGFHVEIVTGDSGLKSYEPLRPAPIPRRRM